MVRCAVAASVGLHVGRTARVFTFQSLNCFMLFNNKTCIIFISLFIYFSELDIYVKPFHVGDNCDK